MKKVLILDGNQRSALAATRSLGRRNVHVVAAGETERTLAGSSKYCKESFVYVSPYKHPEDQFVAQIAEECKRRGIDVLYPMSDITCHHILKNRDAVNAVSVPFTAFAAYEQVTNKWTLFELANKLNLRIPSTHFLQHRSQLKSIRSEIEFPIVVKPYRSRMLVRGRWIHAAVCYATSYSELEGTLDDCESFRDQPVLLQQYIRGESRGIFTLYDRGRPLAFFAHRRLRQKPPSGGVSVLSESVDMHPEAYAMAKRLFDHLRWHGVAMLECVIAADGAPYILEVNARFWGSLQLAIDAGFDFPWLLYQLANGEPPVVSPEYEAGVRSRWLFGDVSHLLLVMIGKDLRPVVPQNRWNALVDFFGAFDRRTSLDVNRWDDLRPSLHELWRHFPGLSTWRSKLSRQLSTGSVRGDT